jgi:hypothetical protein
MAVKGYKAFNSDWTWKDKQYELGESYHEYHVVFFKRGMDFYKDLKDLFRYYAYAPTMKLAVVEASGKIIQRDGGSKYIASDLKVVKELNVNSEEVQLEAVKEDGLAIKCMNNPSEQLQLEAVKQNASAIQYIKNPIEQLKQLKQLKLEAASKKIIWSKPGQIRCYKVKEDNQ